MSRDLLMELAALHWTEAAHEHAATSLRAHHDQLWSDEDRVHLASTAIQIEDRAKALDAITATRASAG